MSRSSWSPTGCTCRCHPPELPFDNRPAAESQTAWRALESLLGANGASSTFVTGRTWTCRAGRGEPAEGGTDRREHIVSDEWDEQLTEVEQNLAASLADLTSVRYGAVVTESARIRRLQVEFGGGPEEPDPPADADPGRQPAQ